MEDSQTMDNSFLYIIITVILLGIIVGGALIYEEVNNRIHDINERGENIEDDVDEILDDVVFLLKVYSIIAFATFILSLFVFVKYITTTQSFIDFLTFKSCDRATGQNVSMSIIKYSFSIAVAVFIILMLLTFFSLSSLYGGIVLFYTVIVISIGIVLGANMSRIKKLLHIR